MSNILFHFFLGYKISQQSDRAKAIIGVVSSLVFGVFAVVMVLTVGGSKLPDKGKYIELDTSFLECIVTTKGWKNKRKTLNITLENYATRVEYFEHVGMFNDLLYTRYMDSLIDACNKGENVKVKVREYSKTSDLIAVYSKNRGGYILPLDHRNSHYSLGFWVFLFFLILSIAIFVHSVRYLINPKGRDYNGKPLKTISSPASINESKINKSDEDKINFISPIVGPNREQKNYRNNAKKIDEKKSSIKAHQSSSSDLKESDNLQEKPSNRAEKVTSKDPLIYLNSKNLPQQDQYSENLKPSENTYKDSDSEKRQNIAEMTDALREFRLKLEREGVIDAKDKAEEKD